MLLNNISKYFETCVNFKRVLGTDLKLQLFKGERLFEGNLLFSNVLLEKAHKSDFRAINIKHQTFIPSLFLQHVQGLRRFVR